MSSARTHHYAVTVTWKGNNGTGTSNYRAYRRDHDLAAEGRPVIAAASDPAFRGDPTRWNPELLLVASLSSCHQLWYLHLCADAGITVLAYRDDAEGWMEETPDGAGQFTRVTLRPHAMLAAGSDRDRARHLHAAAHRMCFIARSVNFPVDHEPTFEIAA